jgi:hypothetical protein
MQNVEGDVPVNSDGYIIPIFMYRHVFFDGQEKLHPGIYPGKLFVMSRSCLEEYMCPQKTLVLEPGNIDSPYLKKEEVSYLVEAFNKKARMFNAAPSGTLRITSAQAEVLVRMGADLSYFSHI